MAVVSPSGPPDRKRLEQNAELVAGWGFEPVLPPERNELYFAGSDQERLHELQHSLQNPAIDLVWASRGGYGTARLLSQLDPGDRPRPVVGFSDLTVLHQALHQRGWTELIHGPVLHSLGHHPDAKSRQALRNLLTEGIVPELVGRTVVAGQAEGPLVGGNLCVLASLCGTPFQLSARGSILLLEDVHEKPYRLDRYLVQLRESGCLDGLLAVVLGSFQDCNPSADEPWSAEEVLEPILRELGVPLVFGLPVGHGAANLPFLYGQSYRLQDGRVSPANRPR